MTRIDSADIAGNLAPLDLVELRELARQWASDDCDADTAALALDMVRRGQVRELAEHFAGDLEFGTAGLRAKVGPGPLCMNAATVRKASLAVAQYLATQAAEPLVVLGFDARLSSRGLAEQCVGVLVSYGVRVRYFEEPSPTPLVAFALTHLNASAAIVITASHNPREYNGLKLYGADGVQIVSPTDSVIAKLMRDTGKAREIACRAHVFRALQSDAVPLGNAVSDAYCSQVAKLASPGPKALKIAYTPLHGVGAKWLLQVLALSGYQQVTCVSEQLAPDGSFPTVAFPNPEEPGVMNHVFALAQANRSELALANDPDADRLAVGIPRPDGTFCMLSGNQVGLLLADYLLNHYRGDAPALVVQSVVSSPMLGVLARSYGARCERTLTGFKWIIRAGLQLRSQYRFLFGYEEALGYSLFEPVRDKDGISAAVVFAELAEQARNDGLNLSEVLFQLYTAHGLWVSRPLSVVRTGRSGARDIAAAMQRVRTAAPTELAGLAVTSVVDYQQNAQVRAPWLGKAALLELELGERGRVLMRPSGTEPKLKFYVDLCAPAPSSISELAAAQAALEQLAAQVAEALCDFSLNEG